jgi:predicted nucleic acid-binding protein
MAAFRRKKREGVLSGRGYTRAVAVFNEEHLSFVLVQIGPQLNTIVQRLIEKYPLRGFDAIHLASALIVKEGWMDMVFACFDKGLNQAAKTEGLKMVFKDPVKGKEKT